MLPTHCTRWYRNPAFTPMKNAHCYFLDASIGVDFGGQPGHVPPIIEKRPCIYHFFYHLSPNILFCSPNIFDKSMPVDARGLLRCFECKTATKQNHHRCRLIVILPVVAAVINYYLYIFVLLGKSIGRQTATRIHEQNA